MWKEFKNYLPLLQCVSGSYQFLVFQDPKDHVFLMCIGLSKQVRMSLPRIVFPPIMCLRNAWNTEIGSLNSDMRAGSGLFWWGVAGGGFRLATAVPYLPFFFFLVFPSQRVVVLPWGCIIKISQSKILRTVLSRWLCLRTGLCIWAPKTLFWRNTMDVLKTSFRRYMTSNYSSFFSFFWSQMAPFIV